MSPAVLTVYAFRVIFCPRKEHSRIFSRLLILFPISRLRIKIDAPHPFRVFYFVSHPVTSKRTFWNLVWLFLCPSFPFADKKESYNVLSTCFISCFASCDLDEKNLHVQFNSGRCAIVLENNKLGRARYRERGCCAE